jgi:hypothetical protein
MNYHRKTLELIGCPNLPLDMARGTAALRDAATIGVGLPTAVVEWYCVPEQSDLWHWYSGEHAPAAWRKAGVRAVPASDDDYREEWINPPVYRDLREWVKGPILPLMSENQGCWMWGVVLDGAPDPPAVISFDGEVWDICADSFSTYVYALIFDDALLGPAGVGRELRIEECVSDKHRRALRREFQVEPTTRGAGCLSGTFTERFSRPGQRFSFANLCEHRFSCWTAWALDPASFSDLVDRLSRVLPAMSGLGEQH